VEFADGSRLNSTDGKLVRTDAAGEPLATDIAGTGTQNRLAKWTDNVGTLGNSAVVDTGVGLQMTVPASALADTNVIYAIGNDRTLGVIASTTPSFVAGNGPYFAMRGRTYSAIANQRGLFSISAGNVPSPTGIEGSILFLTGADQLRMFINPAGNIGMGTNTPSTKLDVVGNINTTTQYNIAGNRVLSNGGSNNLFAGVGTGTITTGNNNAFFGANVGSSNTFGANNSFFGENTGFVNTGGENSFFGRLAGFRNTSGGSNAFFGVEAGDFNTTGFYNSSFGAFAGLSNTTEYYNTFIGSFSNGAAGITNATAIGFQAKVTQSNSLVLGSINGQNGATADTRVGIGMTNPTARLDVAGNINTTTQYNIGSNRVVSIPGTDNIFAGVSAGAIATGTNNSFFGKSAGQANTTGGDNSFVGGSAGLSNTTEHNNTFVGSTSDGAAGVTNATAVGYRAKVTQSNSLVLGSINGQNGAGADTDVGIGTTAPRARLHVAGGSLYIAHSSGLIMKSPNGNCWRLAVDDFGALSLLSAPCP